VQAFGCKAHADVPSLLRDPDVELAIIATPSHVHAEQTIDALRQGKHVVCEKPMAVSVEQADAMIAAAREAGRTLTVFHNMRYTPDFLKVKEVITSGQLGRIVQIKITLHRFVRRWDWQTLRQYGGGALNNAGAHLIDLALQLLGDREPRVVADVKRTLASGDAEDHAKVLLLPQKTEEPTVEIEITNACAYPQDVWHVMGTFGGLRGSAERLEWMWVDPATLPDRPVDREPAAADRKYPRETLTWQEATWQKSGAENADFTAFYEDLYASLRLGAPLAITPESVRRVLAVIEKCRSSTSPLAPGRRGREVTSG
jgi:predicted dehydrogenase